MKQQGFSLIELVTVLLIITVLSTIAIRSTVEIGYNARYEQTKERLNSIKQAIIGNPNRYLNGQPDIHGFVADMGRLPDNVRELVQRYNCSNPVGAGPNSCITPGTPTWLDTTNVSVSNNLKYGWNGPYLTVSDNPANSDAYTDGWGRLTEEYCSTSITTDPNSCPDNTQADWVTPANDLKNYGWYLNQINTDNLTLLSYGKDQKFGGTEYDADYPASQPVIRSSDWKVDISGGISASLVAGLAPAGCYPPSPGITCNSQPICMRIFYRKADSTIGTSVSTSASITENGLYQTVTLSGFSVSKIPVGSNTIGIYKYDTTATPPVCTNLTYPVGRTPIPVLFIPHRNISLIQW